MNKRKRHVADVAFTLFIERGVQQTSIQEIIERANISKGTFYNYFASKTECIAAVLELLRYEAREYRLALEVGKDATDKELLIEQISVLIHTNEKRNLHVLFEGLLHSNEPELKNLVLQHRLIELRWIQERLQEVYAFSYEDQTYEAAVLVHGMTHHMLFVLRVTNSAYTLKELVSTMFKYVEILLPNITTCFINTSYLSVLEQTITRPVVMKADLLQLVEDLLEQALTSEQRELLQAVQEELSRETLRVTVLRALLPALPSSFLQTELEQRVQQFVNVTWHYMKTK
ncbi:MAG: TetR/AcrR family transcriptional regulator [Caryophanon sp.]|nr:TetR/AcrR family transcriptional regulator [Caryophanon sp.]